MGTYTGSDKRLKYLFEHGGGGGGSANIWTGTKAEYEAQASQIADDTAVFITDDEIQSLIVSSYAVYSTDEQVVGTWINGKPLYRKVIYLPSFSTNNLVSGVTYYGSFALSNYIADVDIAMVDTVHSFLTNSQGTMMRSIDEGQYEKDTGNITLFTTYQRLNLVFYVCVEYTKTTD